MPSLNLLTHAVSVVIIGYLIRKYIHVKIQLQRISDIIETPDSCHTLLKNEPNNAPTDDRGSHSIDTSVWCIRSERNASICFFTNLCYYGSNMEFVYFHGDTNKRENLYGDRIQLDLSTVEGHNKYSFRYVDLPSSAFRNFTTSWVEGRSVMFSRFKPDNLMHVIHDDLIPLIHTLSVFENNERNGKFNARLIFADDFVEDGHYEILYSELTSGGILRLKNIGTDLICFENVQIGLLRSSLWYQYGFSKPQGPVSEAKVNSFHIRHAANVIEKNLEVEDVFSTGSYLVIFSRKRNRRILNENQLVTSIVTELRIKVRIIDEEKMSFKEMIALLRNSNGIVGMHGAVMSLAIFLRLSSVIVELFPYAINPDNYTPYKTLANLPGMKLVYRSWRNFERKNTVGYPENSRETGGIFHLSEKEQDIIKGESEVGRHLCCDDPSWLYHIYQDTIVNVKDIIKLLQSAFKESQHLSNDEVKCHSKIIPPSSPQNISCIVNERRLVVQWKIPWNVQYLNSTELLYEVLILDKSLDHTKAYIVNTNHLTVENVMPGSHFVWLRCSLGKVYGPYSNSIFCTSQSAGEH